MLVAKIIMILALVTSLWPSTLLSIRNYLGVPGMGLNGAIFKIHVGFAICLVAILNQMLGFSRSWRITAWLVILVLIAESISAETRSAWLSMIVMVVIAVVVLRPRRILPLIGVLLIGLVVVNAYNDVVMRNFEQTKATVSAIINEQTNSVAVATEDYIRYFSNRAALLMFQEHPVTGVGPNLYGYLQPEYVPFAYAGYENSFNSWLKILAEFGMIGISAIAIAFFSPFVIIWKRIKPNKIDPLVALAFASALGVIGMGVHLFFIDLLYSFVWFHVGLALAAARLVLESGKLSTLVEP